MILEKIEREAEVLLEKMQVQTTPVSVDEIADALKIHVSKAPSNEFSGMLIRKDGVALIGINSSEPATRQRFTIAHELGHFFLHTQKSTFVDYRKGNEIRTPREREADMFAAALLMPRQSLIKDLKKIEELVSEDKVSILAKRYDVSEEAMKIRLIDLSTLVS